MTAQLTSTTPALSYNQKEWKTGYRSLKEEFDYDITDIEGEIPAELHGTLFRNGPGMLDVNGERVNHPFDGDGMICAISFDQGRAHFRNRYVRTEGFEAEQQAGKILRRGVFGTQRSGGPLFNAFDFKLKNIANTQVVYWGKKLLALWEAAEPHRLDPATLETQGLEFFDGQLAKGEAFAAHPWIDPSSKFDEGRPTLVNFAIKAGVSFTLTLYELNLEGEMIQKHDYPLPGFAFIHDFAVTPNYCIFFQNSVQFNPLPFVFGQKGAGECIKFQPEKPTKLIVIPRGGGKPQTYEMDSGFVFHHANAFETEQGLTIDSVCYADIPQLEVGLDFLDVDFQNLKPGELWRFKLDRASGKVEGEVKLSRCCEFPMVHPALVGREYRYTYLGAADQADGSNAPLQGIVKVDLQTGEETLWSAAPAGYANEPVFIPRAQPDASGCYTQVDGAEDDGWLTAVIYDGKQERSAIVILDARTMEQVARLNLKHHVPYGLHGTFTPEVFR
ncbi:carotenoid oxygenase family protein [filamentous cyanobacterium LEGE 11480]|uniref:Carotenoid oxygenase family protein n=1 Tax=Romeriopsis navalis LEGE 11480 TaxID=2777977 RepID=A0A928VKF3_9CYAN|nr:carotenoid oxygenase family protein [Romeriopsis navalis]MBE9028165.1 carotenoid oxygenase family protein [Romeriopsis navalis LEGE 11480]